MSTFPVIRTFLVIVVFGAFVPFAYSQATPEKRATVITEWMKDNLRLSPEQETPVYSINIKYAQLHDEIASRSDQQAEKVKAWEASSRAKKKELKRILSTEQFREYEEVEEAIRKKFKEESK